MASTSGTDSGRVGPNVQPNWPPPGTVENSRPTPPVKVQLTKEEMAVLQQCSRESFWYRSVPLGVLFIGGTQILVRRGFVTGHPRLGALPKSMFAGLVAYIAGKVSYQGECRRKIMTLNNSPLAEAMRKGKRGRELIGEISLPGLPIAGSQGQESGATPLADSFDMQNQAPGLDDSHRPNIDNALEHPVQQEDKPSYTSYDELRSRNRMEHEQQARVTATTRSAAPPSTEPRRLPSTDYDQPQRRLRTNKYGDVVEEEI